MKELTKKVQSLGGSVTALADDASHLVTNKFIRTIKWFVAMNKGMVQFSKVTGNDRSVVGFVVGVGGSMNQSKVSYVVTSSWVNESFNSKWFLDEDNFWIKDEESEKKYHFQVRER